MRFNSATWLINYIPILRQNRDVAAVCPLTPFFYFYFLSGVSKGVRDLVVDMQGICRGGALSVTEAQTRRGTGSMPYHTDRSLDSIALTWLSETFLQAALIQGEDLARFGYSSAHLPVIIHHFPPTRPSWAQNLTRSCEHSEVSVLKAKSNWWESGETVV